MKDLVVKAMDEAIMSAYSGVIREEGGPFGAAIIDAQGNTVCVVHNMVLENIDPTAHAEITAIREACKKLGTIDLTGCTMIATGYPCPMCMAAIIWSNITEVYYGAPTDDCEKIGFRDEPMYKYLRNEKSEINLNIQLCGGFHRSKVQDLYEYYAEENKEIY